MRCACGVCGALCGVLQDPWGTGGLPSGTCKQLSHPHTTFWIKALGGEWCRGGTQMQTVPLPCSSARRAHWDEPLLLLGTFRGSHMGATATSGHSGSAGSLTRSPPLLHPRMLGCPPWAISRWFLSPAVIPAAGSAASPQPQLPSWGQGQREDAAGAGSDSAQGQLLISAVGAAEHSPRASCIG